MKEALHFRKAHFGDSRVADFQLSCIDASVFIDLNLDKEGNIYLKRISFDGYGCCNLVDPVITLNQHESNLFLKAFKRNPMDQVKLDELIRKVISLNSEQIWPDALEEYALISI